MKLFIEEMESRSLTKVIQIYSREDQNGKEKRITNVLVNIYREIDGYIEEHGRDLAEFLQDVHVVDGFWPTDNKKIGDGAGCLAAQIVAHLKKGAGGIYLEPTDADDCGQQYEYYITVDEDIGTIELNIYDVHHKKTIFEGSPDELMKKLKTMPRKHNLN